MPRMFKRLTAVNDCRAVGTVLPEFPFFTRQIYDLVPSTFVSEGVVYRDIQKRTLRTVQEVEKKRKRYDAL